MKVQEESQTLATFVQEREMPAEYADIEWQSRPTNPSFKYCGLDEFAGRYYKCEVKNVDQTCPDFTPRVVDSAPRPCASCRHHRPPLGHPVQVLEATFRRYGERSSANLKEEIRSVVQMQADGEYVDCVDFAGFLSKLPAFLPVCMVRSAPEPTTGETRFVVGPVVNSAARCSEWSAGQNASVAGASAQLDSLVAHVRRIVSQSESRSYMAPWQVGGELRLQANAEAAIVARCLTILGATSDHVAAVCSTFTDVFGEGWDPQLSAQVEASAPRVAQLGQEGAGQVGWGPSDDVLSRPGVTDRERADAAFKKAYEASANDRLDEMEHFLKLAVELGHPDAIPHLAIFYKTNGDPEEAERWFREGAERGNANCAANVGMLLQEQGLFTQSEPWLRQAVEGGAGWADEYLSKVVELRRHVTESNRHLTEEPARAAPLREQGEQLIALGEFDEGERLLREAADQGSWYALNILAYRLQDRSDVDGLRRWLEHEVRNGAEHLRADSRLSTLRMCLAFVLIQSGQSRDGGRADVEEGLRLLVDEAESGSQSAWVELQDWHDTWGNTEVADFWQMKLDDLNDDDPDDDDLDDDGYDDPRTDATEHALPGSVERPQDSTPPEADAASAMLEFGLELIELGQVNEGENFVRQAADEGSALARQEWGRRLVGRGDVEEGARWLAEAERLWRAAADRGDTDAAYRLGSLHRERGEEAEAVDWFKLAVRRGSEPAAYLLSAMFLTPVAAQEQALTEPPQVPPQVPPAAWHPDPCKRYELRYWDGAKWTEHVARQGQTFIDPPTM